MISRIRHWADTQPVRLVVWPGLITIATALVANGLASPDAADVVIGIIALVCGFPATEFAHSAVTSPSSLRATLETAAEGLLGDVARVITAKFGEDHASSVLDQVRRSAAGSGRE